MSKIILITGATDGIGLGVAERLAEQGHHLLLHGRSVDKLTALKKRLQIVAGAGSIDVYQADLTQLEEVEALGDAIADAHRSLEVLINNAGVFKVNGADVVNGVDVRFMVNAVAPYVLTRRLLTLMPKTGRIVNVSSAAQAPVDLAALAGRRQLNDSQAYAQSKLALTQWSFHLARSGVDPAVIAVNPASFLASKMVKTAYGMDGKDLSIGVQALMRAALSPEFADATGRYYDNDTGRFSDPHPDALDAHKNAAVIAAIDALVQRLKH